MADDAKSSSMLECRNERWNGMLVAKNNLNSFEALKSERVDYRVCSVVYKWK